MAEVEVGVGGTGWTVGDGGHKGPGLDVKSGSQILESLSEQVSNFSLDLVYAHTSIYHDGSELLTMQRRTCQLRQMKTAPKAGLLGMGVHTSKILRVLAVDDDYAAQQKRDLLHVRDAMMLAPPPSPVVQPQTCSPLQPALQRRQEAQLVAQVREELLLEVDKIKGWAREEVARERRQNLQLRQELGNAAMLQQTLQTRLDDAMAEARSERHERMRFAATYIKGVDLHRAQLEQKENDMWSTVVKTERLLSQISSQTRAAYSSLCALCVRSRLEIEHHKARVQASLALVEQYQHSCRMLEHDCKTTRLSSIQSSSARLQLAQTVGLAMEDLVAETSEMIREVEGVQKNEVVVQSVSEYLKERLLQSCQELDDVEGQLDRSLEEASLLQRTCENQTIEITDLHQDRLHQGQIIDQYQKQFSDTSNIALDLAKDVQAQRTTHSLLLTRLHALSVDRRLRHSRRQAWCHWRFYLRHQALRKTLCALATNTRGRRREALFFAASILHKWSCTVDRKRNRRRFGAFLWTFARRSSCLRLYTRVLRVWRAYLLESWRFKLCARTHARLHRLVFERLLYISSATPPIRTAENQNTCTPVPAQRRDTQTSSWHRGQAIMPRFGAEQTPIDMLMCSCGCGGAGG